MADAYERARPGYPDDAVRWLAGDDPCDVVDLGAGTGKLTRSLVAHGHRVTAVEPLEEMLAQLRAAVPAAIAVLGSAESIPLPDASADVVTCAQAFHWFDQDAALREIARVLRPGGRIALVWNTRDDSQAWVAELTDTVIGGASSARAVSPRRPRTSTRAVSYGPVEHATFAHVQLLGRDALVELVRSRSHCAVLPEEERASRARRTSGRCSTRTPRDGMLAMPYVTECFRASVPGARRRGAGDVSCRQTQRLALCSASPDRKLP